MKLLTLVMIVLMATACTQTPQEQPPLRWATVDAHRLKEKVRQIVLHQHPYPDTLYFDKNSASRKLTQLKKERRAIELSCTVVVQDQVDESSRESARLLRRRSNTEIDDDCLKREGYDLQLAQLNDEIKEMERLAEERKAFDARISVLAKEAMTKAIDGYAAGKLELIIENKSHFVHYNQSNLVLDVTDAVAEYYRNEQWATTSSALGNPSAGHDPTVSN